MTCQTTLRTTCHTTHHTTHHTTSRWLLATADRLPAVDLAMTQELAAGLLGMHRASVAEAAGALRDAGYIAYRCGQISILDVGGLRGRASGRHGVVRTELVRQLPQH